MQFVRSKVSCVGLASFVLIALFCAGIFGVYTYIVSHVRTQVGCARIKSLEIADQNFASQLSGCSYHSSIQCASLKVYKITLIPTLSPSPTQFTPICNMYLFFFFTICNMYLRLPFFIHMYCLSVLGFMRYIFGRSIWV